MRTKQRNFAIAFISFIMAIAMVFGISSLTEKPVSAVASSSGTPSITMVSGAQARYDASNPGIKFTAEITNYDSSYTYGMLILPEKAFENLENFEGRYHAYFTENGITNFVDFTCHVYNLDKKYGENPRISLALTDIHDYTMGFVGIGYAKKGETYVYAPVNMADNARSIAFVAQMALKYEQGLNEIKTTILNRFINGNFHFLSSRSLFSHLRQISFRFYAQVLVLYQYTVQC